MKISIPFLLVLVTFSSSIPFSKNTGKRLISVGPNQAEWMEESEILKLVQRKAKGPGFMDITDGDLENLKSSPVSFILPPLEIDQKTTVIPLFEMISVEWMENFLTSFSGFYTRYFRSASGKKSSEWLFDQINDVVEKCNSSQVNVSIKKFKHSWGQHSIIARIEATLEAKLDSPIVIIGAHQDSINQWNPYLGRSPGADDDGSGTTTTFQTFKILVESGYVPSTPIEFHWYSAEEGGLLGSQKVAAQYHENDIPIRAMMQVIGISTDFVSKDYSDFLFSLATEYCDISPIRTKCGYACSDHASWNMIGYPSVFIFESSFEDHSPFIHSANDVVENISFEHMAEFVKLVLAWAIELSTE